MNRSLCLFAALLLGVVVMKIAMSSTGSMDDKASNVRSGEDTSRTLKKNHREVTAETAAKILRDLPQQDLSSAPTFDKIEKLCRSLTDDDLYALIDEVSFIDPEGLTGWLRCALWAELGRRDPVLGFDLLQRVREAGSNGESSLDAMDQITSSYLRGRITGNALTDEVLRELFHDIYLLQQRKEGISGILGGFARIFGEYARQNPTAAWEMIHRDDPEGRIPKELYDALSLKDHAFGYTEVFRNLRNPEDLREYLSQWSERWNTPESQKHYASYREQQRSRISGIIIIPEEELIAAAAAASLARFDPEAALSWLHDAGPQTDNNEWDYGRNWNFYRDLGRNFSETARQLLVDATFADHHAGLARVLIQNSPSSAPEVISLLSDARSQGQALRGAIISLSYNRQIDYIPQPGRENRLPDYQGRYDAIAEAIEISVVDENGKERLQKALRKEFIKRLPDL